MAVKIDLPLRQIAFPRKQLLGGKPLLLFDFSLLEKEGYPLLSEFLTLLC